ncbi:Transcription factor [Sesamum alatum]|uniref:Transcription factor n=1 Tax=Sesamum alatum TaxID=300844 RepID=A0AAE1XS49_9LAMI|nr:Transcription factor [Sesamum alatum]
MLSSSQTDTDQNPNLISPSLMAEAKAAAASNSHKEAERRRRKRINAHIATLKSILPNTIKTDKASLLGETVRLVKELKQTTSELTAVDVETNGELSWSSTTSLTVMFPSETDDLNVSQCENSGLIRASFSCDDRPEMIPELIQALKSAEAKVVRVEMSTVGGRTKSVLWVKLLTGESDAGMGRLRRELKKVVMEKSTSLAGSGQGLPGNKRPRYYHL